MDAKLVVTQQEAKERAVDCGVKLQKKARESRRCQGRSVSLSGCRD
jgi:hypothetical protein